MMTVSELPKAAVSPYEELAAYEYLYSQTGATLKSISQQTASAGLLPSEALAQASGLLTPEGYEEVNQFLLNRIGSFSLAINNTPSYPRKLHDSARPTPLIYYRGDIGLLEAKSISIVGARKATSQGLARASKLARELVAHGYAIVSGLARGIDTAALTAALESRGNTIGVIGTPIDEYYPKENQSLQDTIATHHLLVSQVPLFRYAHQPFKSKRFYFPERNELMAAISDATVIVEASDTSGTLTQAKACLHQGRPLFILKSCANDPALKWPAKLLADNPGKAHVIERTEDLVLVLKELECND